MKMIVLHAHIQKIVTDTQKSTEKEKNKPKRSEMAVRAGCRRCAEDGRQKGK